MKISYGIVALVAAAAAQSAVAWEGRTFPVEDQVLAHLYLAGQAEVAVGTFIESNVTDKSVVDYAQMIVADHSAADAHIEKLAAQRNVNLTEVIAMNPELMLAQQQASAELTAVEAAGGKDRERQFLTDEVQDHKKLVGELEAVKPRLTSGSDVLGLVDQTLPTLEKHAQDAAAVLSRLSL